MLQVMCSRPGCKKPAVSTDGGVNRAPLCVAHSRPSDPCIHAGCARKASHGVKGTRKQEYCVEHAKAGMVNLRSKRCAHPGCFKIPTYGMEGSKVRDFCAPHAKPGMVNINSSKCIHDGCNIEASFGVGGDGRRLLCAKHFSNRADYYPTASLVRARGRGHDTTTASEHRAALLSGGADHVPSFASHSGRGMPKMGPRSCAAGECSQRRTHGVKGSAKPQFCRQHAQKGMVDVVIQRCDRRGCSKLAKFGVTNSWTREFCGHHAVAGMVRDGGPCPGDGTTAIGGFKRTERVDPSRLVWPSTFVGTPQRDRKRVRSAALFLASGAATQTATGQERVPATGEAYVKPQGKEPVPPFKPSSDTYHTAIKKPTLPTMVKSDQKSYPGTTLLQTATGWLMWKWPVSLTTVTWGNEH